MFKIPEPTLQVTFAVALSEIRDSMLQDALKKVVRRLNIPMLDGELAALVPPNGLATLAGFGLRGEYFFPVPAVLTASPRLLGYYRLLYGYSQKEFYKTGAGGQFKALEVTGTLSKKNAECLEDFCRAMAKAGSLLLAGMSTGTVSAPILDDLTLLTLGPQLRGGTNVKLGTAAITIVFGIIKEVISQAIVQADSHRLELKNAAGRTVLIELAADPDIIIREQLASGDYRHVVAIEVKGGRDFSNVHNRIGEAEKSHQKARANKYTECWTVVNVDNINIELAKRESPSTDRFYLISKLGLSQGPEYNDFRDRIISLTGTR